MVFELVFKARLVLGDELLGRVLRWLPFLAGEWVFQRPGRLPQKGQARILLDADYYCARYSDAPRRWGSALGHYLALGAREGRDPNPLFQTAFYAERYPDLKATRLNPLVHFAVAGAAENRDPHPLFQTRYYLEKHPGAAGGDINPLVHFLDRGWKEGLSPHPLFDTRFYVESYTELSPPNPLADYYERGVAEGRNPNPVFDTRFYLRHCPEIVERGVHPLVHYSGPAGFEHDPSPLFDTAHYLAQYPEVAERGVNPLVHYLHYGAELGCNPHPLFDTSHYRRAYPDLTAAGRNPLGHYLQHGWKEGRFPHPLFDTAFYLRTYPEVIGTGRDPLADYCGEGGAAGRKPNPVFDTEYYVRRYGGAIPEGMHPLDHYLRKGGFLGFQPAPLFDSDYYLGQHPELPERGENPLVHYLYGGGAATSDPHPMFDTSFYVDLYPACAGAVPLEDYLLRGWKEGRWPNPLFDPSYYVDRYRVAGEPLTDFVEEGAEANRNPNELFDTEFYRRNCPQVDAEGWNPLDHYLRAGAWAGCDPGIAFSSSYYLETNPDVAGARLNPLAHYLWLGRRQGRTPLPEGAEASSPQPAERERPETLSVTGPLVSVIVPVFNTPAGLLGRALESLRAQTYAHWECCVVDDGSESEDVRAVLEALPAGDPRWKVRRLPANQGISRATNTAVAMAAGELVAFLDHDDEMEPDALQKVVREWEAHPETDAVYTDQQTVEEDGRPVWTFHKPDWSPDYYRGVMYVGHLLALRRSVFLDAGGCDLLFDTIQDYELLLRISERTRRIRHVRKVLYSWRKSRGSVASGPAGKPGIHRLQRAAVQAHLDRLGIPAVAEAHPVHPGFTVLMPRAEPGARIERHGAVDGAWEEIEVGEHRYALLRDRRVEVPDDVIERLAVYATQPDAGLVAPLVLRRDGRIHHAGAGWSGPEVIRYAFAGWRPGFEGYGGALCCAREVSLVSAWCILAPAGLPEDAGDGAEYRTSAYRGFDLSLRVRRLGRRNLCVPLVAVTAGEEPGDDAVREDQERFLRRWSDVLRHPDPYWHEGFSHPSHLRVEEADRTWRLEYALGPR